RSLSIETRSPPGLLAPTLAAFTLITRTARACASYPSCVAVYPRDSRSRRVLCRFPQKLHCISLARPLPHGFTGHVARPSRSIPFVATCSMSLIPFAPLLHRDKRAKVEAYGTQ